MKIHEGLEVVLVGCSGEKLAHAAPAQDIYVSPLFKAAREYAEARGASWAILSALHGLVMPEHVLEPYDQRLVKAAHARAAWGKRVGEQLRTRWPGARFVFLAGQDYAACLAGLDSVTPLRGLGVGARRAWLKRATAEILEWKARAREAAGKAPEADAPSRESEESRGTRGTEAGQPEHLEDRASDSARGPLHSDVDAESRCDFCGELRLCAVSELGESRFEGDDTPARICGRCAAWALDQIGSGIGCVSA